MDETVYCDNCGKYMVVTEVNMSSYHYKCNHCGNVYNSFGNIFARQDAGRQKYYQWVLERGGIFIEKFREEEQKRVKLLYVDLSTYTPEQIALMSPFGADLFKDDIPVPTS